MLEPLAGWSPKQPEVDDISVHFGILTDQVPQRLGCVPSVLYETLPWPVQLLKFYETLRWLASLRPTGQRIGAPGQSIPNGSESKSLGQF